MTTRVAALSVDEPIPIVEDQFAKQNLEQSGHLAVWMDNRVYNGLVLYDFTTSSESLLPVIGQFPRIDGTRISYMVEHSDLTKNIWVYDLISGTQLQISNCLLASRSDISGSWVVYRDDSTVNSVLKAKNIDSGVEITFPAVQTQGGSVDGQWVVYNDNRTGNTDVYAYDLSTMTESRITIDLRNEYPTDVSAGRIVFERSAGDGSVDIYAHDLSSGITVPVSVGKLALGGARISGDLVVYQGKRKNGRAEIFLYDLATSTTIQVTNNTAWESWVTISGARIGWMEGAAVFVAYVQ